MKRIVIAALWLVVALPALYQLYTLGAAISHRVFYPYDLEWMEGGVLVHAQRIRDGLGIYAPPSRDFIPYLYTPLYPTIIALFGPSYAIGRLISVGALLGLVGTGTASMIGRRHQHRSYGPVLAGAALAFGLFAAVYPFTKAWYDLVRADTLFLWLVTAGLAGLARWSREGRGLGGHARVAAGAALLALAFFAKQTAILYVGLGGAIVLVLAWRRVITYVVVSGGIGLGFVALLDNNTRGWFWIYVSKIHRAHDFSMDRFWGGFERILWHFPLMTIAIGVGLLVTLVTWIVRRKFPAPAAPLVLWSATFAVSVLVGVLGIATEWSVENAFIPAFLHGALAAGAAVAAVAGCVRLLVERHPRAAGILATLAALGIAIPLAVTCYRARWNWRPFVPTTIDRTAGDHLVDRIRQIPGPVWVPSHPWYGVLAGKTPYVHRMGVKDVTARKPYEIDLLDEAIDRHAFAAIVLDNTDLHNEYQPELSALRYRLRRNYHPSVLLPSEDRPRTFSGSGVVPESIWMPSTMPRLPAGATRLYDFEATSWVGWTRSGPAWGNGPVADVIDEHHLIIAGATGKRFAVSLTGGNKATGRMTSPEFVLAGERLTMNLGGGLDDTKLRVELWVEDKLVATATPPAPGGDQLRPVTMVLADVRGKVGKLVLVDDSETQHLAIDDVWMWATP
ncbi:MAG: hypothetical protein NT062_04770 [Proteobacteria bacterium]|nr:hypothetical protein [Pseudomonadota bacterium]